MFLSFPCAYFTAEGESVPTESPVAAVKAADEVVSLYHSMQLEGVVNWRAFKQAVTGYGKADKKQIQQMVKLLLGMKEIPKPDDAADAIACAITHCQCGAAKEQFRMK